MPLSAPEYWLEWTKNYFRCQFTHVGELIHKETWSSASFGWAEGLQTINPPIYRLTTAVSDIDQTNINRDIRDGNWLSSFHHLPFIEILAQGQMPGGWSFLQLRSTLQGRLLLQLSFFRWLVVYLFYLHFFRRLAGGSTFVFMFFWQPHLSDLMATMSVHRTLSGGERLTLVNLITMNMSLIQITPNSVMQNLHWN